MMNRRTAFALLFVACGSGIAACGGSTSTDNEPTDGSADSTQPGCTTGNCTSEDGSPGTDATLDSGSQEDVTVPDDVGTNGDDGSKSSGDSAVSDAPPDSANGDDASDSGNQTTDSGTDSGDHTVNAGTDSGTDSGDHTVDSGTDSGDHTVDSGTDSGDHIVDSGSGVDASDAAVADAGTDAQVTIPDGGLPPTPGQVSCGANASCAVPANQCCLALDGGGDCIASGGTCPAQTATAHCNEASDCATGSLCCVSIDIATQSATAACTAGSSCPTAQACRTEQECGDTGACTVQNCVGVTLELCGLPLFFGVYQCTAE